MTLAESTPAPGSPQTYPLQIRLWPVTTRELPGGDLSVGGVRLAEIAARLGTPDYVRDTDLPGIDRPPANKRRSEALPYRVRITGSGLCGEQLHLLYSVSPVPAVLAVDRNLHEGLGAGIAIDRHGRVHQDCTSAYRNSHHSIELVGRVSLGPSQSLGLGAVRILFAPFAHTAGISNVLCEARVVIDSTRVRSAAVCGDCYESAERVNTWRHN